MACKHSLLIEITEKGEVQVTGPLDNLKLCMLIISDAIRVIANPKPKKVPAVYLPRELVGMKLRIPGNGG